MIFYDVDNYIIADTIGISIYVSMKYRLSKRTHMWAIQHTVHEQSKTQYQDRWW